MTAKNTYSRFTPLANRVFVTEFDRGMQRTLGGILLPDDDMKTSGIRPRWAKVYSMGPDVTGLNVGEWVLLEHGRWSQRISVTLDDLSKIDLWMIEFPKAVLLVSDTDPRPYSSTDAGALNAGYSAGL